MVDTVFLHIGTYKSGTTHLQNVLWRNREMLAQDGVLVPGPAARVMAFAATDVMRVPSKERVPASFGAWGKAVDRIRQWDGPKAVLSAERLTFAGADVIDRIITDLAPARVEVVLTVRDLARTIPSSWQERIRNRRTWTWPEFLDGITDSRQAHAQPAKSFWKQQDVLALLSGWADQVPVDRIHVVTVPPRGSDPHLLSARFAEVLGSDVSLWTTDGDQPHTSLGIAEAELLRRLNPRVPDWIATTLYNRFVKVGVGRNILEGRSGQRCVRMPDEYAGWLEQHALRTAEGIRRRAYHVVGDLTDLAPGELSGQRAEDLTVTDEEVLQISLDVNAYLVNRLASQNVRAGQRDLRLPHDHVQWLHQHARRTVGELRHRGSPVVSDRRNSSRVRSVARPWWSRRDGSSAGDLLDASLNMNAYLVARLARQHIQSGRPADVATYDGDHGLRGQQAANVGHRGVVENHREDVVRGGAVAARRRS